MSLRYSIYKVQTSFGVSFSCPLRTFICYHILSNLSSTFFKFFQILFCDSSSSRLSPFIRQLLYDITRTSICQELFSCFFDFLLIYLVTRRRLAYTSIWRAICQALFYKNLHLFLYDFHRRQVYFTSGQPLSSGQIAADFRQGIPCFRTAFLSACQVCQADHTDTRHTTGRVMHFHHRG